MELTVNIGYEQLLYLIKQLPANQISKLKTDLNDNSIVPKSKAEISDFQKFLLQGPVMSKEQYDTFLENRKHYNQWRTK